MSKTAFYPGSFDPLTNGHIDIIDRALSVVDKLILGIGVHHEKKATLPSHKRIELIEKVITPLAARKGGEIEVMTFDTLVIEAMREKKTTIMIRGLRDTTDFNYEMQLLGMNAELAPELQAIFLPSSTPVRHISATLVRQIAAMGGDISHFVPHEVEQELKVVYG